jgi:hypothetical protein
MRRVSIAIAAWGMLATSPAAGQGDAIAVNCLRHDDALVVRFDTSGGLRLNAAYGVTITQTDHGRIGWDRSVPYPLPYALPYKVFGEGDYFPMPFEVRLQPAPDRTSLRIMVEYGACDPQGLCSPEEADLTC